MVFFESATAFSAGNLDLGHLQPRKIAPIYISSSDCNPWWVNT